MDEPQREQLSRMVRTMQIIVLALVLGLVFFLVNVCVMQFGQFRGAMEPMPLITGISLAMGATMIVARWVVLKQLTAAARRQIIRAETNEHDTSTRHQIIRAGMGTVTPPTAADSAERQLVTFYQTRLIVGSAMLEGAGFFLLIAHMLERSPWSLAAAVVMIFGIASQIPTVARLASWLEVQMALLDEERQIASTTQP